MKPAPRPMLRCLCLVLLLVCGPAGCARETASPPNIVLIVVDTLRADRLACYGGREGLMPFVDSLAEHAVVFDHAYAQSSWTIPSVASLMISRYQVQDGMTLFDSALPPDEITLAEELRKHGYATGGFSANGILDAGQGWNQGFDTYLATLGAPPRRKGGLYRPLHAEELNAVALPWLDGLPEEKRAPFFLYLQYMDPHLPYDAPTELLDEVFHGRPPAHPGTLGVEIGRRGAKGRLDDAALQTFERLYDAEVMSADLGVRNLFEELGRRHLLDDTIVVITADHGNEFEDHGQLGHGRTLYDEVIHVPLLVLVPGQTRRVDVAQPVGLIDVAPTLLRAAGMPAPARYEGRSFAPVLAGARPSWHGWLASLRRQGPKPEPVVSELLRGPFGKRPRASAHTRAVILGSHKLVIDVHGEEKLYDLAADPSERKPDVLDPAAGSAIQQALAAYVADVAKKPTLRPQPSEEVDAATLERLRAIGYAH